MSSEPSIHDKTEGSISQRVPSVDLLRGIVIILMALDHVRDFWSMTPFSTTDLDQSTPAYFFTRWITHFCAPVFIFLCGTSAWLYRRNHLCSPQRLSWFLLTRGLWLILIEITVISYVWQATYQIIVLAVIWAIGCSMIVLSFLVFLPRFLIVGFGLVIVIFHNALDAIKTERFPGFEWLWTILHLSETIPLSGSYPMQGVEVVYPLIPWLGVIALGYGFGAVFELPNPPRHALMWLVGGTSIVAFLVLRLFNLYGESGLGHADSPWHDHGRGPVYALMSILNTTKYPPSLHYLLMTLSPAIAMLPLLEKWHGRIADWIMVFGRVPFFFYILHLYLIRLSAGIWFWICHGTWNIAPFDPLAWPADYTPDLVRAYVVWLLLLWVLYWPCRWFAGIRKKYDYRWLSYL
ncbi:MAG: heparan-alpha-glucosaminide N-acetyltransferase domain-containing protein [Methylococcaceae bacterium]|nr:heparan-alpha-glucosaminide N-acetyltransferase domain-containing protein [Methylococcaceae bacterium]